MESLDQKVVEALSDATPGAGPARILVAGGDDAVAGAVQAALSSREHGCTVVCTLAEACAAVSRHRFDVIVVNDRLPDGDATELASLLQKTAPASKIIIVSATTTIESAIRALRIGAVDFISLPVQAEAFAARLDAALLKARAEHQRDDRLARLKKVCRELNNARHKISRQVDSLCDDLAGAYEELAIQMSDVAMASEFRTLLKQELDVEDLLRTTLEYLLTKTGPTNAAVFLPDGSKNYGLGAYVNCDCPRETISLMLDHLCDAVCPQMADEAEMVSFDDADEFAAWIGADAGFLADSHIVAFSCRHKDECLAVIVLFRNKSKMFDDKVAATLDTLRGIIAEQLAQVVKIHQRSRPSWPKEAAEGDLEFDDDLGFGFEGGLAA
jgi:DNA-binding response OmpR family regulator